MTPTLKAAALAITFLGLGSFNQTAEASSYQRIDRLALRLQGQAREMVYEFRLHYRHTDQYWHLMSDARQVYRHAAHIHDLVHYRASLRHISRDVDQLDRLLHHLEDLVVQIERCPRTRIRGNTTHVRLMLDRMKNTICSLQDYVDDRLHPHHGRRGHQGPAPIVVPGHGHGPGPGIGRGPGPGPGRGHGNNVAGGTIRFGNDRFSIRFGF